MCNHPQHLSVNDQRLLRALWIDRWVCPGCQAAPTVPPRKQAA